MVWPTLGSRTAKEQELYLYLCILQSFLIQSHDNNDAASGIVQEYCFSRIYSRVVGSIGSRLSAVVCF